MLPSVLNKHTRFHDIKYQSETNVLIIDYFKYTAEEIFLAVPIDLCGRRICVNIQPLSTYFLKDEKIGYLKNDCQFLDSETYKCDKQLDITAEKCMSLEHSMIYNHNPDCVLSHAGAPSDQVISFGLAIGALRCPILCHVCKTEWKRNP